MKKYLLDSGPIAAYLYGRKPVVERDLTIVTADSDYERVPGLRVIRIPLK